MTYFIPQKIECPKCKGHFEYSQSDNHFGLLKTKGGEVICPICLADKLIDLGVPTMKIVTTDTN